MTLDEALYYIHSVCWKGSVPGLERISALLDKMGHPERKLKFIHVTGTNGKGSTCAMLASMFTKAGYKTGLYTSPFLIRFNERIQIDGVQISDEEICRITEYIKPLADSIFEQPTEFEMVTALGFEYFARQGCDLVVCEVGMGGEFDATNVILPPEAAVICNIGLDHTEVLGDTLEKIAATKSGIIKPGCDAVIYREQPSVEAVIEDRCKAVGAKLHKADFADIHLLSHDLTGQVFDWERFKRLKLPLLGDHQLHNAAVALTTATVMQQRGWKLTDDDIREGLASVRWPGRFDVRRSDPLFIIDGGHNPQCIQALVKNIQDYHHHHAGQPAGAERARSGGLSVPVRQARHGLRPGRRRRPPGRRARRQRRRCALLRLPLHDRRDRSRTYTTVNNAALTHRVRAAGKREA